MTTTWRISALGDNQFSFQNYSSSGGFLFRGDQQDSGDDYRIWGHNTGTIDGSKGDRYLFRLELIDGGGEIYRMYTRAGELVKAGNKKDGDGDHEVFAQPSYNGSDRYQWVIVPVP
ncbi:hypothetical protein A167_03337 [Alcanivorax sp. S71-1-4]|uniref:hypothetical protein n=1 Tax=Alcanivorax sp. S71-1-4 TaxID=1177159 RepID=UPI00135BE81B|nr:hypothetical protein [Alcanivorax sp. S71-1-4]KAF0805994.1 hypothetical protein A167_03337 [Alcanivorax sp. S71-1-4]